MGLIVNSWVFETRLLVTPVVTNKPPKELSLPTVDRTLRVMCITRYFSRTIYLPLLIVPTKIRP